MFQNHLFRIRQGKEQEWRDWCAKINRVTSASAANPMDLDSYTFFTVFDRDGEWFTIGMGDLANPTDDQELNRQHLEKAHNCLEPMDARKAA